MSLCRQRSLKLKCDSMRFASFAFDLIRPQLAEALSQTPTLAGAPAMAEDLTQHNES